MENKEKAKPSFDEYQKRAINILQNAVVSAGAGSGKTTVLSERFLQLVQKEHYKVEEILTLTFTKKATVEMSSRIYQVLREKAPEQAADFYKANIKTLDSYCNSVAKMGAHFYGIAPDFTQDDSIISQIKQMALPFVLKNRNNEAIKLLVKANNFEEKVQEIFVTPIIENSTVAEPIDFDASIEKQIKVILDAWQSLGKKANDAIFQFERAFSDFSGNCETKYIKEIKAFFEENGLPDFPELTEEDIKNSNEQKFTEYLNYIYLLGNIKQTGAPKGSDELKEIQKTIREYSEKLNSIIDYIPSYKIMNELLPLLKEFQETANNLKRSSGHLTFKDISNLAVCTLREHPEIRQIEKNRYKAIMIDEFQDNNSEQRDMLFMLAEKPERMQKGVPTVEELCAEKLFFVGDEKQSIYRFRGADVSVFRSLSDDFKEGNLSMTTNYRSDLALIGAFNTIFGGFPYPAEKNPQDKKSFVPPCVFFTEQKDCSDVPLYEAIYHKVSMPQKKLEDAKNQNKAQIFAPKVHFALYNANDNKEYKNNNNFFTEEEAEAEWTAQKISELIEKGQNPSEIAILFRNYNLQPLYERTLLKYGIPYNTEVVKGFFNDGPANDIIAFLRLCAYPEDTQPYAQILRSPLANLQIQEINAILSAGQKPFEGDFSAILDSKSLERYEHLKSAFIKLKESANTKSIAEIVSEIWYDFGYRYETMWNSSVSMYAKMYDLIFELACRAEQQNLSLGAFVDSVENYKDENEKLEDIDIPLEQAAGVHLLTIHKSKGLEYEVIFICGSHKKGKTDSNSEAVYSSKDFGISINNPESAAQNYFYNMVAEENKKMQNAELRRLTYVALTRAKKEIYITNGKYSQSKDSSGFLPGAEKNPRSIFEILEPVFDYYMQDENKSTSPFSAEEINVFPRNSISSDKNVKNNAESKLQLLNLLENSNKILANSTIISEEEPAQKYISPSKLHTSDEETEPDKQNIQIEANAPFQEINRLVEENKDFGFNNFGTIAHAYLEAAVKNTEPDYSSKEIIGLHGNKEKLKMLEDICIKMQKEFIESTLGKQALNSEWKKTEFEFRGKIGTKIIKGIIDLVFKNADGTYTIIDYKTNQTIQPEIYKWQLSCYKQIIKDMLGIDNSEKIKTYLYYLRFGKAVEILTENSSSTLSNFIDNPSISQ